MPSNEPRRSVPMISPTTSPTTSPSTEVSSGEPDRARITAPVPEGHQLEEFRLALLWRSRPSEIRFLLERLRARSDRPGARFDLGSDREFRAIPESLRRRMRELPGAGEARQIWAEMTACGIRFLVDSDQDFPDCLRMIPDPPPFLFYRGDPLSRSPGPRVGIVGSRAASGPGREIARALARDLALAGSVVVSGLARGIDGEAHRGALDAGGRSIAILGTGLDQTYPPEHRALGERIVRAGGLWSEFPPGVPPLPLHFPRRNRVLAGLCDLLVVVEGGERSGARSTVDHALDQGKEVLAVPRDILHPAVRFPIGF